MDRVERPKHARLLTTLILSLLWANGWGMSVDGDAPATRIATELAMDAAQEQKFWPIFREYRYELAKLDDARRRLLDNFREHRAVLSIAQGTELIDAWLDNQRRRVKLMDRFVKRFRRILPDGKVARLLIMESARAAAEDAQAVVWIPAPGAEEEVAR